MAAIGFCYGGKVILDLARSGADLKAAITFHANLSAQKAAETEKFKAQVLVLHGEKTAWCLWQMSNRLNKKCSMLR